MSDLAWGFITVSLLVMGMILVIPWLGALVHKYWSWCDRITRGW